VVANSCSTATGSYDDLEAIGKFCEKHNLWLHVDGAHGTGVLFSDKYRHLIKGIERADSIVIDFHKMLLVPGLNTMVMFREGKPGHTKHLHRKPHISFRQHTSHEWYNSAKRTLECTKSSLGLVAFTAFKYFDMKLLTGTISTAGTTSLKDLPG
jgi:L-2,4-diaminobutyrate decarboxylase